MIAVGLTGNAGSGKTTVAEWWREAGVPIVDADAIGHAVLAEEKGVREPLVRAFGKGILSPDGAIDRARLGEAAFSTSAGIATLNGVVHPPLLERLDAEIEAHARRGAPLVVVDAALIFEFRLDEALDVIVLVTAPAAVRAERLRRRGMSDERIAKLDAAQMPDDEKVAESDLVIVNDGSLDDLRASADRVLAELIRIATREEDDE